MANLLASNNCLNLIRFIGALQVLYGHSLEHLEIDMPEWLTNGFSIFQGVPIFFVLSGFLIPFSIERSKSFKEYALKRFWRIYPELWIAVAFEFIVMLVFHPSTNVPDVLLFMITQSTIFQFWTPDSLREYGCGTPNGALWTITVLVQFYLVVWVLYKMLHGKKSGVGFYQLLSV